MDELNKHDFFFCYSNNVSDYLSMMGIRYITKAIMPSTNRYYSLYYRSKKLEEAMDNYEKYKKSL